jgi:molybdopterin adenylyltransferase
MHIKAGIITVSDRAARGIYPDRSGPAVKEWAIGYGWQILAEAIVPDEKGAIQKHIRDHIAAGCGLVLTTGGTGVAPRDITPEAVREIADREIPGFGELMRLESLKLTPKAILSRSLAAVVGNSLVICLPGKPEAAVDCLTFVAEVVPHCLELLQGQPGGH